jgi:glycosyltransferase involved in cell wall biosynthesis
MIGAMRSVVDRHPDALYVIAGRTHPELARREGESYRESLRTRVHALGLEAHVIFVDRYLDDAQIIRFLLASDVYVTPYLDPNQITSGTLSYALGAGKAIVSTPYLHAQESLAGGRGLLVPFRNEAALAEAALLVLENPSLKALLERRAYLHGRDMTWPMVGMRLLTLYRAVACGPTLPAFSAAQRRHDQGEPASAYPEALTLEAAIEGGD